MGKKVDQRIPPRRPVWNIWQGLLLISLVALIEYSLGWLETPTDLDSLRGILYFIGIGFGDALITFSIIWLFLRLIDRSFTDLGFVRPLKRYVGLGFVVGIFLFLTIGLLGTVLTYIVGTPAPQSFTVAVKGVSSQWEFGLLALLSGVVAPLKEEMLFRGLIYPPLRQAFGKGKGMLLTGLFFATLHLDIVRFLPLLIGGVVLAWLYERSGSIWPAVVAHGTWNILMAAALWIQRS